MTRIDAEIEALETSLNEIDQIISEIDPILEPLELDRWQAMRARYVNWQAVQFATKEGF